MWCVTVSVVSPGRSGTTRSNASSRSSRPPEVEPGRGLVEREQRCVGDQPAGEHDPRPLAFRAGREEPRSRASPAPTAASAARAPDAPAGSASASRIVPGEPGEHDVDRALLRVEAAAERGLDEADPPPQLVQRHPAEPAAEHLGRALARAGLRRGDPEQRRLPGAVRPDDPPVLARASRPVDPVEDRLAHAVGRPPEADTLEPDGSAADSLDGRRTFEAPTLEGSARSILLAVAAAAVFAATASGEADGGRAEVDGAARPDVERPERRPSPRVAQASQERA